MKIIAVIVTALLAASSAHAETTELRVAKQYGLGYLQMMLMEDQHLIEKEAAKAGLGDLKVTWATFRSSDVMNDALISGSVDLVALGPAGLATIWAKTRGNLDVRGVSAMNAQPNFLNTRKPEIASIRDFTDKDRIALPAVKVAMQALALEMAAAQAFGPGNYAKLDSLTVSMAHPDGMTALLSGAGEITAHYTSAPYQYLELKRPGIHKVLDSYEAMGGPYTFNVISTTAKFRTANPKVYAAFLAALRAATDQINRDKPAAAAAYLRIANDKSPLADFVAMMNDPQIEFTLVPKRLMAVAEFMHQVGTIKVRPGSWKDLFFDEAQSLPGS